MTEEIVLQLTSEDQELLAPEMEAVVQAQAAYREARDRLTRMLMLRCPEFRWDESIKFDAARGAFIRAVPVEAPEEPSPSPAGSEAG